MAPGEFAVTVEEEGVIVADYAAADNAIFLLAVADGIVLETAAS